MSGTTTIQVDDKVLEALKKIKVHPRQSYNELIAQMIEIFQKSGKTSQYDEFLHRIQQQKMKELWDNKADEDWEHA